MSLEVLKELAWTDYFLYTIVDPRELYRRIRQGEKWLFQVSFFVPLSYSLFYIVILSLNGVQTGFFYHKISYGWLLILFFALLKIVIYSALVDSSAQFFGHKGNIREVIILVNFSIFPTLLFLPCFYIISIADFIPGFMYIALSFVFFCWFLYILVQGISEMYSIDSGRALLIVVLPVLVIGVLLFFIFVLLFFSVMGFFAN